jgi:glycosyltransferase involved in cell wall biosynthesis
VLHLIELRSRLYLTLTLVSLVIQRIRRLAIVVSHPIQYYAPLYKRLAQRDDVTVKVFFTWHDGRATVEDHGFKTRVAWDIPLTEGYEFELVSNVSTSPGTHSFFGLRNPSLVERVTVWRPDVVHVTGWAWLSHLMMLRALNKKKIPTLFRGDSHLLDTCQSGLRWWAKRTLLKRVYSWPTGFLVTGAANRSYYEAFGIEQRRLFPSPHSIDVSRFAEPANALEQEAAQWRQRLGIARDRCVLLYAGKFERKKRPIELMRAVQELCNSKPMLVMVGSGELEAEVNAIAATNPNLFRVLPFQNQSRMPVVYRLGDLFVLPSAFGETWGLAVNEALACGRPVLVSDHVGCAPDVVDVSCGWVFSWADQSALVRALDEVPRNRNKLLEMGRNATKRAWCFDIGCTEDTLVSSLLRLCDR